MDWLHVFGLVIVVLLLIPNIIYFNITKNSIATAKCTNKFMNILEQLGRYACVFFMVVNLGFYELGFKSNESFSLWFIMTGIFIVLYWLGWIIYYRYKRLNTAMFLAIVPGIIFLETGISMSNYLLTISSVVFLISHIYVTYVCEKDN